MNIEVLMAKEMPTRFWGGWRVPLPLIIHSKIAEIEGRGDTRNKEPYAFSFG
jgi:hypothetical protein